MRFLVTGQVVLPVTDDFPLHLGRVTVGRLPPGMPSGHDLKPQAPTVSGIHAMWFPQVQEIHSECWYWTTTDASTAEAAFNYVRNSIDPAISAALSLIAGSLVVTRTAGAYAQDRTGHVELESWRIHFPRTLTDAPRDSFSQAPNFYTFIKSSETASAAARHMSRARAFEATAISVGPLGEEAALLEYVKALEVLAGDERFKDSRAEKTAVASATAKIVQATQDGLAKTSSSKKKASLIMASANDIRRAKSQFLGVRLDRMAAALQLDAAWRADAEALVQLRNRALAHAGGRATASDLKALMGTSEGEQAVAARTVLSALHMFVKAQ